MIEVSGIKGIMPKPRTLEILLSKSKGLRSVPDNERESVKCSTSQIISSFQLSDYIKSYLIAKRKIIKALNATEPYEYGVVIDRKAGKILQEYVGDRKEVDIIPNKVVESKFKDPLSELEFWHGHPERILGVTGPLSLSDSEIILIKRGIKKVGAFNKQGKNSYWKKIKPSKAEIDYSIFRGLSDRYKYEVLSQKELEKKYGIDKLMEEFNELEIQLHTAKDDLTKVNINERKLDLALQMAKPMLKINTEMEKIAATLENVQKTHEFWKKYSHELGLQYVCNFPNLT